MKTYIITSSAGVELGTYEAETKAEALDLMAADAGYWDQTDAERRTGQAFEGVVEERGK